MDSCITECCPAVRHCSVHHMSTNVSRYTEKRNLTSIRALDFISVKLGNAD